MCQETWHYRDPQPPRPLRTKGSKCYGKKTSTVVLSRCPPTFRLSDWAEDLFTLLAQPTTNLDFATGDLLSFRTAVASVDPTALTAHQGAGLDMSYQLDD